jgi:hypothetical protein
MKNINVFGYATFGMPNGFTQSCIYGNQNLEKVLKTFDLKTNAIQLLSPNDRIYSIRKEATQNNTILSYSVYTYAKERNSNRSGTFIGTSLVLINEILPENLVLKSLHEIHQNLKNNNVSNNVLNINHSKDFNIQYVFSKDFEKLEHQSKPFEVLDWENSGKNLVIYTSKFEQNEIQNLFKKTLQILAKYDTIYFVDSKVIAEFVSQKKLFRLIEKNGLDEEIAKLENEKKQKLVNTIESFKNQKQKREEEGRKEYEVLKKQIEQDEQKHLENGKKIEEADKNLSALNQLYANFLPKFDELISQLNSGKQLEEVNQTFKQFEQNFNEEKRKLGSSTSISSLSNLRTSGKVSPYVNSYSENYHQRNFDDEKKSGTIGVFSIVSLVMNVLLIGGLVYLYLENDKNEKKLAIKEAPVMINEPSSEKDSTLIEFKLNPQPNDFARDEENKKYVLEKLTENSTTIEEAVDVIFNKNKIIKEVYQFQKGDYADNLMKENPDAFDSNKILIKKDLLQKIPFYHDASIVKDTSNGFVSK